MAIMVSEPGPPSGRRNSCPLAVYDTSGLLSSKIRAKFWTTDYYLPKPKDTATGRRSFARNGLRLSWSRLSPEGTMTTAVARERGTPIKQGLPGDIRKEG